MHMIYHITTPEHWATFKGKETYRADSLDTEGFIHCSTAAQLPFTAQRYYHHVAEIWVLCIDETLLQVPYRFELAPVGESFPHIYGELNQSAVTHIKKYISYGGLFSIDPHQLQPLSLEDYLKRSISYEEYVQRLDQLLAEGKTTGPEQNENKLEYARLNRQRIKRNEKQTVLLPEWERAFGEMTTREYWLVIGEGWCGDAAQIIPVMHTIARASNEHISLRLLWRDENPELMDQYLTSGTRSIPKLIRISRPQLEVMGTWGPRPVAVKNEMLRWKSEGISGDKLKELLHAWYAKDKSQQIQQELLGMIREPAPQEL